MLGCFFALKLFIAPRKYERFLLIVALDGFLTEKKPKELGIPFLLTFSGDDGRYFSITQQVRLAKVEVGLLCFYEEGNDCKIKT